MTLQRDIEKKYNCHFDGIAPFSMIAWFRKGDSFIGFHFKRMEKIGARCTYERQRAFHGFVDVVIYPVNTR